MRKALFTLALLASALSLPVAAHADTIDDFVLTGEGHTITYSLPNSAVVMDHPHGVFLQASAPTTIDGVPGYIEGGDYYIPRLNLPSVILSVPSSIDNGSLTLWGPNVVQVSQIIPVSDPSFGHPDDLLVAFVPGTYNLTLFNPSRPVPSSYSLTITEEPSTAATPEPSTLLLFATGLAGGALTLAARHRTRIAKS
jgi:hypothetical protein